MTYRLGVVMDPIASINYKKDSTLAMLWEAERRQFEIYYMNVHDLLLRDGRAFGHTQAMQLHHDSTKWATLKDRQLLPLADFDVILMRKDPPFNEEYIYSTYILEQAERQGVLVVNRPQALRDANEKLFAAYFPECSPPCIVTQSVEDLRAFWREHKDIVCKPLNTMGGVSVFRLRGEEVNANVIFETLIHSSARYIMAQKFIPEITQGDKRIILINGEPIPHALARVPQGEDWRGNLAVGAKGSIQPLTERDHFICAQIGPELRKRGLYFVGIDVIGDYLTEINVTSPTGIRQLDEGLGINISSSLFDCILAELSNHAVKMKSL